jgi:hypothetical protein
MKKMSLISTLLLMLSGLNLALAQSAAQFYEQVDASTLQSQPLTQLPSALLSPSASAGIADMAAFAGVIGEEVVELVNHPVTDYQRAQTANFELEMQPSKGLFFAIEKEHLFRAKYTQFLAKPPQPESDASLIGKALEIIAMLGIQPEEMGPVQVRRVVAKTPDGEGGLIPRQHSAYVTVQREINEVPIINSTVTVSYNLDGTLHKVMGRWPKLANAGHRISHVANPGELRQEVARQLADRQTDYDGDVLLSYLYDTRYNRNNRLMLTLKVQGTFVDDSLGEGKIRHPIFDFEAALTGE